MESDRLMILMFSYAEACISVLSDERHKQLNNSKIEALKDIFTRCKYFLSKGFDFKIIEPIISNKSRFIIEAKSQNELKEILKPSEIFDDGSGELKPKRPQYHVNEEELLMWSLASAEAPLNSAAIKRMQNIFCGVYPELKNIF